MTDLFARSAGREKMEAERDRALAALVSLDREWAAGEVDEASYRGLRDDYTSQAAAAIRALEADSEPHDSPEESEQAAMTSTRVGSDSSPAGPDPAVAGPTAPPASYGDLTLAPAAAEPPAGRRRTRTRRGWMLPGALLAFVIAAGILVGRYTATRQPGQEITGNPPVTAAPSSAEVSSEVAADLLEGRTEVSKDEDVAAAKEFATVLALEPKQPEALAYDGWVLRLAGVSGHKPALVSQGRALVAEAVALDPSYPDAHVFLGFMYFQDVHSDAEAVVQFKDFLADKPLAALVTRTAPVMAQAFKADHQAVPARVTNALQTPAKAKPAATTK